MQRLHQLSALLRPRSSGQVVRVPVVHSLASQAVACAHGSADSSRRHVCCSHRCSSSSRGASWLHDSPDKHAMPNSTSRGGMPCHGVKLARGMASASASAAAAAPPSSSLPRSFSHHRRPRCHHASRAALLQHRLTPTLRAPVPVQCRSASTLKPRMTGRWRRLRKQIGMQILAAMRPGEHGSAARQFLMNETVHHLLQAADDEAGAAEVPFLPSELATIARVMDATRLDNPSLRSAVVMAAMQTVEHELGTWTPVDMADLSRTIVHTAAGVRTSC